MLSGYDFPDATRPALGGPFLLIVGGPGLFELIDTGQHYRAFVSRRYLGTHSGAQAAEVSYLESMSKGSARSIRNSSFRLQCVFTQHPVGFIINLVDRGADQQEGALRV